MIAEHTLSAVREGEEKQCPRRRVRRQKDSMVQGLHDRMRQTAWKDMKEDNAWSMALCALILAVEPNSRRYAVSDAMPYNRGSIDDEYVIEAMANLGYVSDTIRTSPSQFDHRLCPALYVSDERPDRPCILLADGRIYDSGTNRLIQTPPLTDMGKIIMFRAYTEERDPTSQTSRAISGWNWFRASFTRFHSVLARIFMVGLVLNLMALITPLFIMAVYDRVISTNTPSVLPMLAAGALLAAGFEWLLRVLRSRQLAWMASRLDNIVSNRLFSQLLHMPPAILEGASVQAQIARLKTYEAVRDFFSSPMFLSVIELPFTILAIAALTAISGTLVIVPLVGVAAYTCLFYIVWRKVQTALRIAAKAGSARQRYVLDTLTRLEDIRSSGLPDIWKEKYKDISGREALAQFRLNWLGLVGETAANAITVLSAIAIVGFGVGMVWSGAMSTGALVASMILVWRVLNPFYSLCTMVPRLDQLRNSIRQINQLMDVDTEERASRALAKPQTLQGRLTFNNVTMQYGLGDPVFTGLSFQTQPGQIIAITGENGAGKSSLLKLAKGLYQASAGTISLDGFDVRQLNPLALRRKIAYIPQNPSFFAGTVEENLRFANPVATMQEIEAALMEAEALEDIKRLPQGLQTVVGNDKGAQLSSSLAMRLSLARSYLHDATLILVDELPNSLMSSPAGRRLVERLVANRGKRTTLLVTYHVDMLRIADQIVWLRLGEPPLAGERNLMLQHLKQGNW